MSLERDPTLLSAQQIFRELAQLLGAGCARLAEKHANELDDQHQHAAPCHALVNGKESRARKGQT